MLKLITGKRRLPLFAVLATVIVAIGLGVLSFWTYRAPIRETTARELAVIVDSAGHETASWLKGQTDEVRALSASPVIVNALSSITEPRTGVTAIRGYELGTHLRAVQKKSDSLAELTVGDEGGRVVASSASTPSPLMLPASWADADDADGVVVGEPRWDDARKKAILTMMVAMRSADNQPVGVLAATFDVAGVQPRLRNVLKSSPTDVILVARDGKPLHSAQAAASTLTPIDSQIVARLRERDGEAEAYRGHRQHAVVGVAKQASALPVLIVAERNRSEVYGEWRRMLSLYVLLVVGFGLLAASIVAHRFARSRRRSHHSNSAR